MDNILLHGENLVERIWHGGKDPCLERSQYYP